MVRVLLPFFLPLFEGLSFGCFIVFLGGINRFRLDFKLSGKGIDLYIYGGGFPSFFLL